MKQINISYLLVPTVMTLLACQPRATGINLLTSGAKDSLVCQMNFDDFNNRIYEFWLEKETPPTASEFRSHLLESIQKDPAWAQLSPETLSEVVEASAAYYQFLTTTLTATVQTPDRKLELLTALELGDQGEGRDQLQLQWVTQKETLSRRLKGLQLPCQPPTPPSGGSEKKPTKDKTSDTGLPKAVEGLRRAFATAYQSCRSLNVPALTTRTQNLEGIRILKKAHPDGVGRQRVYGDVDKIIATHPYYQTNVEQKVCFDARNTPLIYDYGGKPRTTASEDSLLDFFSNAGSGTNVLGIDCSGFIFSAIARGGLNLAPNKSLKAVSVHGISARMFKDPANNGLTCFAPIRTKPTESLLPGDIIASNGHVVMIDQVGEDPFGLRRAGSINDCNEQVLTADGFDFVITHSSPWKDGVGINRSKVSDYLPSSESFAAGLSKYAIAFCQSRFQGSSSSPINVSEVSVVRHKGTPECLTTPPLRLRYESCVNHCSLMDPIETI